MSWSSCGSSSVCSLSSSILGANDPSSKLSKRRFTPSISLPGWKQRRDSSYNNRGASKVFGYYGLKSPPYKLEIRGRIVASRKITERRKEEEIRRGENRRERGKKPREEEIKGKAGEGELVHQAKFMDALEPYMSQRTLEVHWGVHHRGYVEALNKQLEKNDTLYGCTIDELIKVLYNNGNPFPEFNDAAQVWNHDFFWESMQPGGGDMPTLGLLQQIEKDFGSFTNFKEKFTEAALTLFGSGWVWLVLKREAKCLAIVKTSNSINPLVWNDIPITSLDMWEHAYYLDYRNDKAKYVNTFVNHLVSWNAAAVRMVRAQAFVNLGEPKIPIA